VKISLNASVSFAALSSSSSATGTIGNWVAGPPLPTLRANHCSVAIDNWILAIGGNDADGTDFVRARRRRYARPVAGRRTPVAKGTTGADTGGGDTTVLVAQARYSDAQ
jgi:hypothetical protein